MKLLIVEDDPKLASFVRKGFEAEACKVEVAFDGQMGKALFQVCLGINPRSYFIEGPDELDPTWLADAQKVGICGATSTPMWLMEQVRAAALGPQA